MRFAIACGLVLSLAVPSLAQSQFHADLNATQVVPPTQSNGDGFASFVLNANDTVTYTVKNLLVSGTGASIHTGAVGVNGPLLFTLSGGPTLWSGTTAALTATDKANLGASGLYVQVDSATNPGGDIRGQIVPLPMLFGAHLTGDQETPPVSTSALGDATFVVNSNGTITYNVTTTGLTGTAAHIHTGAFGVGGGVTFALSGGPTTWSGTTAAMTATQFATLQTLGMYVNVHTTAHVNGEIRGQIVATEIPYGFGGVGSVGAATLHAGGAAMRGGNLSISVAGGLPSGSGLLILSLSDGAGTAKQCPYLLGGPLLIVPIPLDATGAVTLNSTIPDLTGSLSIYLQYFGFDAAAPNGAFYSTNGLQVPLFDY
jgi:hypothetical protein